MRVTLDDLLRLGPRQLAHHARLDDWSLAGFEWLGSQFKNDIAGHAVIEGGRRGRQAPEGLPLQTLDILTGIDLNGRQRLALCVQTANLDATGDQMHSALAVAGLHHTLGAADTDGQRRGVDTVLAVVLA